jgi:hypothetical protein
LPVCWDSHPAPPAKHSGEFEGTDDRLLTKCSAEPERTQVRQPHSFKMNKSS